MTMRLAIVNFRQPKVLCLALASAAFVIASDGRAQSEHVEYQKSFNCEHDPTAAGESPKPYAWSALSRFRVGRSQAAQFKSPSVNAFGGLRCEVALRFVR